MRLRITTESVKGRTIVHVDGELLEEGVPELRRVCDQATEPLTLDLANLNQVDAPGIELLDALTRRGARLQGMNPYVALLLRRHRKRT